MVEIGLKKPSIEAIAPNSDAVRDAVSPAQGLQNMAHATEHLKKAYEELKRDTAYADASTEYTSIQLYNNDAFLNYANSLDPSNPDKMGEELKAFKEREIRKRLDNFVSKIPNREVRSHFHQQKEQDLRRYGNNILEMQIGVLKHSSDQNIAIATSQSADSIKSDSSNANLAKEAARIHEIISSLPMDPATKQANINNSKQTLHKAQVVHTYEKTPEIFDSHLSVKYAKRTAPTDPTSMSSVVDSAGERELEYKDSGGAVGVDGWNNLDSTVRSQLLRRLASESNAVNGRKRVDMNARLKIRDAMYKRGELPSDRLSLEEQMDIYGVERGFEIHALDELKYDIAPQIKAIRVMSESEYSEFREKLIRDIADADISEGGRFKTSILLADMEKAHKDSMAELQADPIKWGIKNKEIDPLKFDTAENFGKSLAQLSSWVKRTEAKHGITPPFFNAGQEKLLREQMLKTPSYETVLMYQQAVQTLSGEDKGSAIHAFSKIEDAGVSAVATLSSEFSSQATTVASSIALGAKHRKDVEAILKTNTPIAEVDKTISRILQKTNSGLYLNNDDANFKKEADALKLYLYGKMHDSGEYKVYERTVGTAIEAVYGNHPAYINSQAVLPPRGMAHGEFLDRMYIGARKAVKEAGVTTDNAQWGTYKSLGGGVYQMFRHNRPVFNDKGEPVVVDVHKVTRDELRIQHVQHEYNMTFDQTIDNLGLPDTRDID